jgi:hypothetical protein
MLAGIRYAGRLRSRRRSLGARLEPYPHRSVANQSRRVASRFGGLWNRRGVCRPGAALAPSGASRAASRWCNRHARFCIPPGPACADALLRRAQVSDVARLAGIPRVTRLSRGARRAPVRRKRQGGAPRGGCRRAFWESAGPRKRLVCRGSESATGEEYLSKSEGFSACQLPFHGGLP